MMINTNAIVSASEANQNFSRVTRIADAQGQAVIFKNNKPKYLLVDIESTPYFDMTDDEKIDVIAARILKKFKPAFEEMPNDSIFRRKGAAAASAHDCRNRRER